MRICIVAAGAIGSVFADRLAKAGHHVTAVARGERLARLQKQSLFEARAELDEAEAYDLVMVTLFAHQVDALLPSLSRSKAKKVMFLFNTFEKLDRFRDAVGAERFELGFPGGIFSKIENGELIAQVRAGSATGSEEWAKVFRAAGIPMSYERDMPSWLRTHAAMVAPLMAMGVVVANRHEPLTWKESKKYSLAMFEGFSVVKSLGHALTPGMFKGMALMPGFLVTLMVWLMAKTEMQKQLGRMGSKEPRMLIDQMTEAAPGKTQALLAIRP